VSDAPRLVSEQIFFVRHVFQVVLPAVPGQFIVHRSNRTLVLSRFCRVVKDDACGY
jgi:hypothetical protein